MRRTYSFKRLIIKYGKGKRLVFKNRLQIPAMDSSSCEALTGMPNAFTMIQLGSFASGGFGSITTGCCAVSQSGLMSKGGLGLWNDSQENKYKEIVNYIHSDFNYGTIIGVQLFHAGRKGSVMNTWEKFFPLNEKNGAWQIVAPSPIPLSKHHQVPKELTINEIHSIEDDFANAAVRAQRAGFDYVELHVAHGYLLSQFLVESLNHRTDEYGGSYENRTRIVKNIIKKIGKKCGDFPVFVRCFAEEGKRKMKGGNLYKEHDAKVKSFNESSRWNINNTITFIKELSKLGVLFFGISYGFLRPDEDHSNMGPSWMNEYTNTIKKAVGKTIKIGTFGEFNDAKIVEKVLKEKVCDVIQIGKGALENPFIANMFAKKLNFSIKELEKQYVKHSYCFLKDKWERQKKHKINIIPQE